MPLDKRWTLVLLFLLFLAPVVLAILMHSEWWDFRPQQTRNHGELIEPPVEIPQNLAKALGDGSSPGMWSLLLAAPEGCGSDCRTRLDWLNRVRQAQAQHRDAVRVILATAHSPPADPEAAPQELAPGLTVIDGERGERLLQAAPAADQGAAYIIDPEGFIILSYTASADPTGIRKDLDRLLTWSQRKEPDSPGQ